MQQLPDDYSESKVAPRVRVFPPFFFLSFLEDFVVYISSTYRPEDDF